MGSGKSAFIVQLLVWGSNFPEQNNLNGFNSLKEYSLQPEIIMNTIINIFLFIFMMLVTLNSFILGKLPLKLIKLKLQ